jgi:hypothetical protein
MLVKKSTFVAFFLALFFGPVGMIYVSFAIGFFYFLLNCLLFASVVGMPLILFTWLFGALHAVSIAQSHNKNLTKLVKG